MRAWGGALVAVISLAMGCSEDTLVDGRWSQRDWEYLQTLRRQPPQPPDNPDLELARAKLGQALFFDTSYSDRAYRDESRTTRTAMSCATCHKPPWFVDTTPLSQGVLKPTRRNTIALVDVAYQTGQLTWIGQFDTVPAVLDLPLRGPMQSAYVELAATIATQYRSEYELAYGPIPGIEPGQLNVDKLCDNAEDALAAYERQLTTGSASFDYYLDDPVQNDLSESAKHGLELFIGDALCSNCHTGQNFADGCFHNTGVPQVPNPQTGEFDRGRYDAKVVDPLHGLPEHCPKALEGAFRTPSLRNVTMTAPYMHAGQFATLDDVVDFYWRGGADGLFPGTKDVLLHQLPELTAQDRADLVAFLQSLTSAPVDPDWYQ
jgi:cytochrome c peroxidase